MSAASPSLHYHGLPASGATNDQSESATSLTAPPLPEREAINVSGPLVQYANEGCISTTESRNVRGPFSDHPKELLSAQTAQIRQLPPREVTDQTLDDAYVAFILHCNPAVPMNTDSAELRKVFRAPPRSDGKNFSTYRLFELIRMLENKEIRTWSQLAIQLGVEPPSAEKNQSAQKVQQYAVRLKVSLSSMPLDWARPLVAGSCSNSG